MDKYFIFEDEKLEAFVDAIAVLVRDILENSIDNDSIELASKLNDIDNDFVLWIAGANPEMLGEVRKMCMENLPCKEDVLHDIYNV